MSVEIYFTQICNRKRERKDKIQQIGFHLYKELLENTSGQIQTDFICAIISNQTSTVTTVEN